jgi:DNA-binding XRE family transcriptional regulator
MEILNKQLLTISDSAIVAKATLRAAEQLCISQSILAKIIGISESSLSRMASNAYDLDKRSKSYELALVFIRLFRSLDAIMGGDRAVCCEWIVNNNTALNARPVDLIQSITGLMNVVSYLDAKRAL